jgi:hypothetical protein
MVGAIDDTGRSQHIVRADRSAAADGSGAIREGGTNWRCCGIGISGAGIDFDCHELGRVQVELTAVCCRL